VSAVWAARATAEAAKQMELHSRRVGLLDRGWRVGECREWPQRTSS
jgi:hypothetical protein